MWWGGWKWKSTPSKKAPKHKKAGKNYRNWKKCFLLQILCSFSWESFEVICAEMFGHVLHWNWEGGHKKGRKTPKCGKMTEIEKNVFCSKFCVLSVGEVLRWFVRNVLVTFYTEIGRGSLKMEKNVEMCAKSKKSKKMFSIQNFVLFQKKTVSFNLTFFFVLNLRDWLFVPRF